MNKDVKDIYIDLHEIPEKSRCEEKTSSYIANIVEKLGFKVIKDVGSGYSVVAELSSEESGPTLALSADIDALVHMVEGKEKVVHSCGHDASSAILLSVANYFAKNNIKCGKLKLIFKAAEEVLEGALQVVEAGALDDVDYVIGLHLRPIQEVTMGKATASLLHGGAVMYSAYITGMTAHGARPHLGVNSIDIAVSVVNAINAIHEDPAVSWSAKVTKFNSNGVITNAIPDRVDIDVDIRAENNQVLNNLLEKVNDIIETIPKIYGGFGYKLEANMIPASDYDVELTSIVASSIEDELGKDGLIPLIITPGGDDFHFFKNKKPHLKAAFIGIGADLTPGLHNPEMKFDLDALNNGEKILINTVKRILS